MKFALLGVDKRTAGLAEAIAKSDRHELVWFSGQDPGQGDSVDRKSLLNQVRNVAPSAREGTQWQEVLEHQLTEVVIVSQGENEEIRQGQMRALVRDGRHLVVSHPSSLSVMQHYELEMQASESGAWLIPLVASLGNPAFCEPPLKDGQLVIERRLMRRSRTEVLKQFARDVELIAKLASPVTAVAAMGPAASDELFPNLSVQMTTATGVVAQWRGIPADASSGAKVTLSSAEVNRTVDILSDQKSSGSAGFEEVARILESTSEPTQTLWQEATRCLEVTEAVEKSLRKGRTIKLSYEGRGEENAFKGTMASLGCALLIAGMLVPLVVMGVQALANRGGGGMLGNLLSSWPYVLLGVLVVFLLLQALRMIIPQKFPSKRDDPPPS